jgi:hypothetical protein
MSPRIALVSWILPVAALLCFRALVRQPSPSIYSTGTEVSAWWLLQATGSLGLRIALTLLRLAWKTRIGVYTLVASVVGLVVTTYFAVFRLEIAPYSVQLMFTLVMVNLVALLQPPVVLVLTGSERTLFVERICELVFPHRAVALLSNRTIGMTMWFTKSRQPPYPTAGRLARDCHAPC